MSLILNIDTAVTGSSVCLASNGINVLCKVNPEQRDSASWLHTAIQSLFKEAGKDLSSVDAIAVSAGPGSYTGLRVGMATAKGLCYALNKPLITLPTLKVMASSALYSEADLFCPMIDARRMEVFTATYNKQLEELEPARNLIIDENSFSQLLENSVVCFSGNGSFKLKSLVSHPNALFQEINVTAADMALLAEKSHSVEDFASLAYTEPYYGKDFHSTAK